MPITTAYTNTATISSAETSLVSANTTLPTITAEPGIYQVALDLSALAATDTYELRIYDAAAAAGTKRIAMRRRITGALDEPIYITPSLLLMHGWDVSLTKIAGTDRSVSWSIRKVA